MEAEREREGVIHMRFVVQRVSRASLAIDGEEYSRIGKGLMVLAGIAQTDTQALADRMVKKLCGLRIFEGR